MYHKLTFSLALIFVLAILGANAFAQITVTPDELNFGEVTIGSSSQLTFDITNNSGSSVIIENITIDDGQFGAIPGSFTIPISGTQTVTVTYVASFVGQIQALLTIWGTGNNELGYVDCSAIGGTDMSGEISGFWSASNSPYHITNDVSIPDGQSLTIEAGTVIAFDGPYGFNCDGILIAEGTETDSITFQGNAGNSQGGLTFVNSDESILLKHCKFENLSYGTNFYDDFNDGVWQDNWNAGSGGGVGIDGDDGVSNSKCLVINSTDDEDKYAYTNPFIVTGKTIISFWFRVTQSFDNSSSKFYWKKNNGSWNLLFSSGSGTSNYYNMTYKEFDITSSVTPGDEVSFKVESSVYYGNGRQRTCIDNFSLIGKSLIASQNTSLIIKNCSVTSNNSDDAIYAGGGNSSISFINSAIWGSIGYGIYTNNSASPINILNSIILGCSKEGLFTFGSNSPITVENSVIANCEEYGIRTNGSTVSFDHATILNNTKEGVYLENHTGFSPVNNSIIWSNGSSCNYQQIFIDGGILNATYSDIQGYTSFGVGGNGQYVWGEGMIESNPVFEDDEGHLSINSPCVDAAMPWEYDNLMPPGLGGVRADMGAYGGPDNAGWGGSPLPSGVPVIQEVLDVPENQGGEVVIQFSRSPYDGEHSAYDVTHYSIWRSEDVQGSSPSRNVSPTGFSFYSRSGEYWGYIGEMPAQQFEDYGYVAPTLVDSTASGGTFWSKYCVIAHTPDDDIFFVSEADSGYSVDNLPPNPPGNVIARSTGEPGIRLVWEQPTVEDYHYTQIYKSTNPDFTENVEVIAELSDTTFIDDNIQIGQPYYYRLTAIDYHENESPFSQPVIGRQNTIDFNVGSATSLISEDVLIPITVADFTNISLFQFSIHWDETIATFVGVEEFGLPGLSSGSFGTTQVDNGTLTVSWDDPSGTAQTVDDGEAVFAVRFNLTGNLGDISSVYIDGNPTSIEVADSDYQLLLVNTTPGEIITVSTVSVQGEVIYYDEATSIEGAIVHLIGDDTQEYTTSSDGNYFFELSGGGNYTVETTKDGDSSADNGVSTLDIALIRKHILNTQLLDSPYKIIAGDVNQSENLTTLDIGLIRKVVLGIENTFPNGLWQFVPQSFDFADTTNPFPFQNSLSYTNLMTNLSGQNFIAMKLGDVNNSWSPSGRGNPAGNGISNSLLNLTIEDQQALEGSVIAIPVKTYNFTDIGGYQFTLNWDSSILEFAGVENFGLHGMTDADFGVQHAAQGKLTTLWWEPDGMSKTIKDGSVIFDVKFRVLGKNGDNTQVYFSSDITKKLAHNGKTLSEGTFQTSGGEIVVTNIPTKFNLGQNFPNPFNPITKITFDLPKSSGVSLSVYDISGRLIKSVIPDELYEAGRYTVEWDGTDSHGQAVGSGIYLYKLEAEGFNEIRKMTLLK